MKKRNPILFRASRLPKDIPTVDFHIHTTFTDGKSSIEEYIISAIKKGLSAIAFTEHVRKSSGWFGTFSREVKNIRKAYPQLKIYYGIEAKALDYQGALDATTEMINESEVVIGAVHRYPGLENLSELEQISPEKAVQMEFEASMGLIENAPIDILAHPGGIYEKYYGEFPVGYFREIVKAAKQYNVAIEINSKYCNNIKEWLEICISEDIFISLGSDAHSDPETGTIVNLLRGIL
ncbi:PHP domain-containing protein [candidate division KSB1 bacterium]|nr:PHP domain-containing protein [candidate division KSB1 bacterium]